MVSGIEAVARDIVARIYDAPAEIDRYWHVAAAQLEAGEIGETGNVIKRVGPDEGLAAYRDWCERHPESRR